MLLKLDLWYFYAPPFPCLQGAIANPDIFFGQLLH